ncbi:hypothetical protein Syun_017545 [Stephania yunnanensis]|uniref:Uncharacterized protein n=1 Tax=Stephania yunnanensis TaxID=152371 RepID=A0AAP0J9E2_9MAGN
MKEINRFIKSLSLEDMVTQVIESVQECRQICDEIRKLDFSYPALKDLQTSFDRYGASLQRKIDEVEFCSTQPTFNPEEDVSDDTLTSLEVNGVTPVEDYSIDTSEECEVFQIEPEIIFYTADTFVLDDPDTIDAFVLEFPNELLNMKEHVNASMPKYVDAPFVVDISKGEGIT